MIKKITKIKNLGIFTDWISPADISFKQYNLFYGWNGSGKSTLSKLFRAIENEKLEPPFEQVEFEIETDSINQPIINQTFTTPPPIVKVFNQEFVIENTHFDKGTTESIIYLGKDNAELKKEIDTLKNEFNKAEDNFKKSLKDYQDSTDKEEEFYIDSGRELKIFFSNSIFAQETYNKNNAETIWGNIKSLPSLNDSVLKERDFNNKKAFIAQNQNRTKLSFSFKKIKENICSNLFNEVNTIIHTNPIIETISRLKQNPDISQWVQQGKLIHDKHQSNNCEFCGQKLPAGRLLELSNHFNEEFFKLQKTIQLKKEEIKSFIIEKITIDTSKFYDEYTEQLLGTIEKIDIWRNQINEELNAYLELLDKKNSTPLLLNYSISTNGGADDILYNQHIDDINFIIAHHNKRVDEFDKEAAMCRESLEKHIVAKRVMDKGFKNLLDIIQLQYRNRGSLGKKCVGLEKLILDKEKFLQDDGIAIEGINKNLHKFLGRNEITLEKNKEGGYILKRNGNTATNLSEGEKTAIALIYFIAKLIEKDNNIKSTIVVFDDPISSFDSNHLYNASVFITNNCKDALQVFILTHNFWFFKLIRDWMKKDINNSKAKFYSIKKGEILTADKSLIEYNSEYHFVFSNLLKYQSNQNLTWDDSFAIANCARRVLESFNSFKTPNKGIRDILTIAHKNYNFSEETTEQVYYFLNKYSHLDRIENHENTIENIQEEGITVVKSVLDIIKEIDPLHFVSMEKICR
ncbi:MAG: AAA family ATPase [Bacteroidia bacterium]